MVRETLALVTIVTIGINLFKAPVPIEAMSIEERAALAYMTAEEFELISSVTEAESNRCQDNTEGRRYIALCILCRVMDTRFPDTITEVLCAPGQFSTVNRSTQTAVTNRTDLSDRAVIEAVQWIHSGEEYPWVLYFNCRGYNGGTPYAQIGGNYFMTMEPSLPTKIGG